MVFVNDYDKAVTASGFDDFPNGAYYNDTYAAKIKTAVDIHISFVTSDLPAFALAMDAERLRNAHTPQDILEFITAYTDNIIGAHIGYAVELPPDAE